MDVIIDEAVACYVQISLMKTGLRETRWTDYRKRWAGSFSHFLDDDVPHNGLNLIYINNLMSLELEASRHV